ncbi:MAG: hypothetical protein HGB01_10800 [Chlorobiaceae bacterium]|nr:hypothetical protein [Chlorobiaceae bacterium]
MLLLTLTYGGQIIRCSTHTVPLGYQWYGFVSKIDPIQVRSSKEYGGWLQVSLPTVTFTPELFDPVNGKIGIYPPPRQIQAKVQGTGTDESVAVDLCSGVLALKSIGETAIEYELYSSPYLPFPRVGQTLTVQYSYNGSSWHNAYQDTDRFLRVSVNGGASWGSAVQFLMPGGTSLSSWAPSANLVTGFFSQLCSRLGLTLDASLASSANPIISGAVSSDTLLLDVADAVAAYFSHWFWIEDGTLHLVDVHAENGLAYNFGIWDYVRGPKYTWQAPVNSVTDDAGKIAIYGNTLFGRKISVGSSYYGADNSYLRTIATTLEMPQVELSAMDFYGQFRPGRRLYWIDERHPRDLVGQMAMRAVQYDFGVSGDRVTIIGEASLST